MPLGHIHQIFPEHSAEESAYRQTYVDIRVHRPSDKHQTSTLSHLMDAHFKPEILRYQKDIFVHVFVLVHIVVVIGNENLC
jgi:hypothetical protein